MLLPFPLGHRIHSNIFQKLTKIKVAAIKIAILILTFNLVKGCSSADLQNRELKAVESPSKYYRCVYITIHISTEITLNTSIDQIMVTMTRPPHCNNHHL